MIERAKPIYRTWFLAVWAIFTVSLTVWWLIFGLRQLNLMTEAGMQTSTELVRGHRMLLWEGATLVFSLILGALSFYLLGLRERKQSDVIQKFFLTFTHELKTPMASLRLQAEELGERLRDSGQKVLLDRLITDTTRLTLQLENSLFVASTDPEQFIPERVFLTEILETMRGEWPRLKINLAGGEVKLEGDKRALQSIFRNLVHNSLVHGKANEVSIHTSAGGSARMVQITVQDDGRGFQGDVASAGDLFQRQYSGSGSGIGLYLVCKLAKMLGGSGKAGQTETGFIFHLELPGLLRDHLS